MRVRIHTALFEQCVCVYRSEIDAHTLSRDSNLFTFTLGVRCEFKAIGNGVSPST